MLVELCWRPPVQRANLGPSDDLIGSANAQEYERPHTRVGFARVSGYRDIAGTRGLAGAKPSLSVPMRCAVWPKSKKRAPTVVPSAGVSLPTESRSNVGRRLPIHIASLSAAFVTVLTVSGGCGSGFLPNSEPLASSSTPAAGPILGAQSCSGDQTQDLTLSGSLTGHIQCPIAPAACHRTHGPGSPGVQVLLLATAGSRTVTLRIAFGNDHVGSFTATPIGDEPNLDQQGVTLTGIGTWSSPADGGTMTIVVEDPPSLSAEGRVSGSVDVKLISAVGSAEVKGSWTCIKTLAGGDGWSSA